jgi:hypothetical protein
METMSRPFIFFLTLEDRLPASFYAFNRTFRDLGFILVPVKADQLQILMAGAGQSQAIVLCSVTDSREYKLFNDKVRGLLKYLLRSRRLTFFQLSSFSKLNDTRTHSLTRNYYFLKYPLDARVLSARIARYHEERSSEAARWPGGTRAGVKGLAA